MNNDLVVAVFAVRKVVDGIAIGKVGTAYPVSENLLLTSGHVVRYAVWDEGCGLRVRENVSVSTIERGDNWIAIDSSNVIFPEDESLDVALIRTPQTLEGTGQWGRLVGKRPKANDKWTSCGFPAASRSNDVRKAKGFRGGANSVGTTDASFEIDVEVGPDSEDGWGGVSGMPVFFDGEILGVVSRVEKDFGNRVLIAVAGWRILEDENIRQALAPPEDERIAYARRELARLIIRGNEDLRRRLAVQLACPPDTGGDEIVKRLLNRGESGEQIILELALGVARAMTSDGPDRIRGAGVGKAALDLVCIALPAIKPSEQIDRIRQGSGIDGSGVIENVAALETEAEIVMAGYDGSRAHFVAPIEDKDFPRGLNELPAAPESGRSDAEALAAEDLRLALTAMLEGRAAPDLAGRLEGYLKQKWIDGPTLKRHPDTDFDDLIREELRAEKERSGRSFYCFVDLSREADLRQDQTELFRALKKRYPEVFFLTIDRDETRMKTAMRNYRPIRQLVRESGSG